MRRYAASGCDSDASLRAPNILFLLHTPQSVACVPSYVMCAQLAVATAMRRYADERLRDSNASLRARKMFYFCYADGAVATVMRRYIHVNVIFLRHTPQSVVCVSFVYLCVRELGDCNCNYDSNASLRGRSGYLRRRYVAARYVRSWRLRQRCVATRTDERLRDSNASLRARKMFYFCYADGAVATAMHRYIH